MEAVRPLLWCIVVVTLLAYTMLITLIILHLSANMP